ncbi:MFS transporter [Leucobacter chromiireducens]|uniref:MFS transporter n=1 Tax=Leucobacter chromiireducens subsp. solipictus TaxID=398235 RepID=A0ABS1SGY6_9MICO|nr:MFS transporter [Leucobacter chromiireducens]MBL3679842.1 MFS transporter [Leucobacter chromiireducens subsp. solipictus]
MSTSTSSAKSAQPGTVEPWNVPITKATVTKVSIVCFIAWVASVYDYTLFGTLLPVIAEDFGWSTAEMAAINTYATIGVFIVSLIVGTILDRLGRKRALILLMIGGAVASGFTGLAAGAASLIIIRAFSGFSMSEEVVNAVYLNEIYKNVKSRGLMYALVQGGWPVGALISAGMSALLLPVIGWRWSFVVAGVLSLIVVWMASRLPESPTFAAIQEVRRRQAAGDVAGAEALAKEHDLEAGSAHKTGLKDVFTPELRRHTTLLALAWFANWVGIQIFSVLGTTVLVEAKGVSFDNALLILVLANAVGFAGYVFHGWIGDKIGRKRTVVLGWLAGGIISLIMLLGPGEAWFVIPLYALTLFFLTGPYAALLYYMGESFPAHVRGMGTNVAHVMAPVGGIVGSALLAVLLSMGVSMGTSAILTGSLFMIISALCMMGTRNTDAPNTEAAA